MSGNPIHGLQVPAFQRPNNLELSEFDKDNGFPYVSAANGVSFEFILVHLDRILIIFMQFVREYKTLHLYRSTKLRMTKATKQTQSDPSRIFLFQF